MGHIADAVAEAAQEQGYMDSAEVEAVEKALQCG
jgi:hypothetical protein